MEKNYNDNPTISDTVVFNLVTTDVNGVSVDPYKVNNIVIYFIERGFTSENIKSYATTFVSTVTTSYFEDANPIQIYGTDDFPAWLVSDTSNAFITKEDFDDQGNPQVGVFRLEWIPELAREGDYFLCYSWTPIAAGDVLTQTIQFYLYGNTRETTSIPTHFTVPDKYETLLELYLPEMFKMTLVDIDLTPDVLNRLNISIAKGFTTLEDLANQILDLIDANAVSDALLPYLGNLFGISLKGSDVTLWRRQIKRAVPLYKKKGTLGGLQEALSNAGINFIKITKLWQVVSKSTWHEVFSITAVQAAQSTPVEFTLMNQALLPVNTTNYELSIRMAGQESYTDLTLDYVTFQTIEGITTMTWVGDNLSVSPISLAEGDFVSIIYEIATPVDQSIENYIRSLPLADQRDEASVTLPYKNWNVRLIGEDDAMFDVIIPERHPFHYPLVYGKIRTEFPYSENIYNMEEYNGCGAGNTRVITENGNKRLDTIGNDQFILTEFGFRRFSKLKNQGKRKTFDIKTKMGRKISVTPNHKFRILNNKGYLEWKQASDILPGDFILGKKGCVNVVLGNKVNQDIWYLAGFAYGDGYLYKDRVHWMVPSGEEESKGLLEIILENNGAKFNVRKRTKDKHQQNTSFRCNKDIWIVSSSRKQLPDINSILPSHKRKGEWKVNLPPAIWTAGEDKICSFLRGLFDTDGGIQKGHPVLTTKWISLAEEVQSLFLMLGILSSVTSYPVEYNGITREYFRVRVIGRGSVDKFASKIGFNLSRKMASLDGDYLSTNVQGKKKRIFPSDRVVIPYANIIINNIFPTKKRMSKHRVKDRTTKEKRVLSLITRLKQGQLKVIPDNLVADVWEKAIEYGVECYHLDLLNNYVSNDWFFDKVSSISDGEEVDVFDPVAVNCTESYISNGLVSHNSTRDSTNPCDLDKTFSDACSSCQSSKFTIDVEIEDLSADRLSEAEDIIRDYVPFHAIVQTINYTGSKNEYIGSPVEEIEVLGTTIQEDNVIAMQMDFNRLIIDGSTDVGELKRDMLASTNATAATGTGTNLAITMFSPGIRFDTFGIDNEANYLEILAGSDQGEYEVVTNQRYTVDIVQNTPDAIGWPLDTSAFPFRLSNLIYSGTVSIYQDNSFVFSDDAITFINYGATSGWLIAITSGSYAGTYDIDTVNSDNTITILGFPTTVTQSGLQYELRTPANAPRLVGTSGSVNVIIRGRVETDLIVGELGVRITDYVQYDSVQYQIVDITPTDEFSTVDEIYIDNYAEGDVVGVANINIYRRLVDNGIGYLELRGMNLNGVVPTVSYVAENNLFQESYLILIGTTYYQIANINGNNMVLNGPQIAWGLSGTPVSYSIIQFVKTSPITAQDGHVFNLLDRRGNDSIEIITEVREPMFLTAASLNGQPVDAVKQSENIWFNVEWR